MSGTAVRVVLAGNPNAGKTTLFNRLTGARHRVANYPGTTVESREGRLRGGGDIVLVDLPGTYSLSSYTEEERVARQELTERTPDLVVQVVDASNLERNLYLTAQLFEMGLPAVLALNMNDTARARGISFDLDRLSSALGVPVVATVGHRGEGIAELAAAIRRAAAAPTTGHEPDFGPEFEQARDDVAHRLREAGVGPDRFARWLALKLLENDAEALARVAAQPALAAEAAQHRERLRASRGESLDTWIAAQRYAFVANVSAAAATGAAEPRPTVSDRVDAVLAHPLLGAPVFLAVMYVVFWATFRLADPPMRWLEHAFDAAAVWLRSAWPAGRAPLLQSLAIDGVLGGVGGVVSFVPNILLLFGAIAVLEDSGYLARAALLSDRLMRRIGLHGRSFIPLLIGFGCTVPAILATRMLETRRDRLTTMLILPLISCGARLPIYSLLIPAFFPEPVRAPMLLGMYLTGIALAVLGALLLRRTLLRGEPEPLIMELPPYRLPTLSGVLTHMLERGWTYLRKAGTVILAISVVLWALTTFPRMPTETATGGAEPSRAAGLVHSAAGRLGRAMEPALRPMGFDWRIGTAMIGAFAAKEVFVAQLGIVFSIEDDDEAPLRERLQQTYPPRVGLCMMLFMLIGTPCMATVAVTRRESGAWRWPALQFGGLTALAWLVTTAVNQIGLRLGF